MYLSSLFNANRGHQLQEKERNLPIAKIAIAFFLLEARVTSVIIKWQDSHTMIMTGRNGKTSITPLTETSLMGVVGIRVSIYRTS